MTAPSRAPRPRDAVTNESVAATGGARRNSATAARSEKPRRGVPLRVSLVALTLVLVAVGLLVSGIAVTSAMRSDLMSRTDQGLVNAIGSWAKPRNPGSDDGAGPPIGPRRPPSSYFVMTTLNSGAVLSNASDFTVVPSTDGLADGNVGPITVDSSTGGGPHWRLIKHVGPEGVSIVAVPLSDVNKTISRLVWLQLGIGVVVVVVIGILSYLLVRSSLRPLRRVEETAHAIAAGNLNMRVAPGPPNTEVGSLSASLNIMLGQIQHAFATTAASEKQARSSEEKMRQFVADASHELRTPLTSIKGFAELYRQGAVTDAGDAMRRIDDEAGRMKLLVEDLLMLARLDAQRPLNSEPVDMLMLAADSVQAARAAAPGREIALHVEPSDEPPVVEGDAARLVQVIRNLVNNAVVHTPEDASITVGVEVDPEADDVLITVNDTGQGLTQEERDRVFERFYRGDSSRSRGEGGGSGLGLSIVAALIGAHGGRVGVDSAPGSGATFWVRLPRMST